MLDKLMARQERQATACECADMLCRWLSFSAFVSLPLLSELLALLHLQVLRMHNVLRAISVALRRVHVLAAKQAATMHT